MKKTVLLLIVLYACCAFDCDKHRSPSSNNTSPSEWSAWDPIGHSVKVRYRRIVEDVGGNYEWLVLFRNDGSAAVRLSGRVEVKKGNGTSDTIERVISIPPGQTQTEHIIAASITRVSVSNIE